MSSLDFKLHRDNFVSIKDMSHDLDISEGKWDKIFDSLFKSAESIYFYGTRRWVKDDYFEDLALSLGEERMIDEDPDHWRILFRLRSISMMFSRKSLSKLWLYYEYHQLYFFSINIRKQRLSERLMWRDIIQM